MLLPTLMKSSTSAEGALTLPVTLPDKFPTKVVAVAIPAFPR